MIIPILLLLIIALLFAGYYFARVALYPRVYEVSYTLSHEVEAGYFTLEEFRMWPQEEVTIHSPFGYPLFAVYLPHENSQKTVVISHGITWSLYGSVKYAILFRQRGFNVLLYDLRNHGRSGGSNTTFGYYEKHDLKAVVDWAFQRLGEGGIVGTFGESLGAATTLQNAAIDPRLSFAIADCAYSDLVDLFTYRLKVEYHLPPFPLLKAASLVSYWMTGMRFEQVSPIHDVANVETPIFFIHGSQDDYIQPSMSVAMYRAKTKGIRKLYIAEGAKHAQSLSIDRAAYDRQLGEFLQSIGLE